MEVPESWRRAAKEIAERPGAAVVLGPSDSGKTTFIGYCLRELSGSGQTVAVVDADIGQSSVGPPTTVGLALFDSSEGPGEPPWPAVEIRFVGEVSPPGHLLQLTAGTATLAAGARERGSRTVLVDTTGLVRGDAALALKRAKLSLIGPAHIVVLGADESVERIVAPYVPVSTVHRLEAPSSCRRRSLEERAANREALFRAYFSGAEEMDVDGSGFRACQLIGLAGAGDRTMALAAVTEVGAKGATVRTPLPAADRERVKAIQLSDFTLSFPPGGGI